MNASRSDHSDMDRSLRMIKQETGKSVGAIRAQEALARLKIMNYFSDSTLKDVDFVNLVEKGVL